MSTRKTFDAESEAILPPHGEAPLAHRYPPIPCNGCGTLTPRKELAELGARCRDCYERYCRAAQPKPGAGVRNPTPAQAEMLRAIERHEQRMRPHETGEQS